MGSITRIRTKPATRSEIEESVRSLLNQGADPKIYAASLASHLLVTKEAVIAVCETAGQPRAVDAETVAQERLAAESRMSRADRRDWGHEED
jgi:hypothetical protein